MCVPVLTRPSGDSVHGINGHVESRPRRPGRGLRLEPDSRAEIAAELLASLDGPADPDAEAAWDG